MKKNVLRKLLKDREAKETKKETKKKTKEVK
jgi:hypothetical protein